MKKNKFCFLAVTLTIFIVTGLTGCSSDDNSTAEEQEEVYTDESGYEVINYEGYDYDYLYANLFNGNSQSFIDEVWNNSGLDDKLGQKTVHGIVIGGSKYVYNDYRVNRQKRTEIFNGTIQLSYEADCSIYIMYDDDKEYSEGWLYFAGLKYVVICNNENEAEKLYMEIYDKLSATLPYESGFRYTDTDDDWKKYREAEVYWTLDDSDRYYTNWIKLAISDYSTGESYDDSRVVELKIYRTS